MKKRLLMGFMAAELVFTQVFSGFTVVAGDDDVAVVADFDADYVEGEAIVCVKEGGQPFTSGSMSAAFGGAASGLEFETIFEKDAQAFNSAFSNGSGEKAEEGWSIQYVKSDSLSTEQLVAQLENMPGVLYAQPNYIYEADPVEAEEEYVYVPDGATFGDLTAYQFAYGAGPGGIDVPDWNDPEKLNAQDVVVAVLDSGVDHTNPDLAPVMWEDGLNESYTSLKKFGGSKYGFNAGYMDADGNYVENVTAETGDNVNGHGTHCAGIIAAAWNGVGVSGAANGCKIMSVRNSVNVKGGSNTYTNVLGFFYIYSAVMDGVNVAAVNCSWGGSVYDLSYNQAIDLLGKAGVVTCFAAGNESSNVDVISNTSNVFTSTNTQICVNSATKTGDMSWFSNYGIRNTHLFSPGSAILSTFPVAIGELFPDAEQSVPVEDADGVKIIDDFSTDTQYFSYEVNDDVASVSVNDGVLVMSNISISGNDALTLETVGAPDTHQAVAVTISLNKALPADGSEYNLIFNRKAERNDMYMKVYVKTVSGGWDRPRTTPNMTEEFALDSYTLTGKGIYTGESFDLENLEIRMVIFTTDETVETVSNVYLDDIWITAAEKIPFKYLDGTSMATPAVVGAVAILAAQDPDDTAEKRTARILASVRKDDRYQDLCITGGMVNVRNALDESTYTPVLFNVESAESGKIKLSGYFFGSKDDTALTISQDGKKYSTEDGSLKIVSVNKADDDRSELIFERPEGLTRGEIVVTITDTKKPEGRQSYTRYMNLIDPEPNGNPDPMYNRISVSSDILSNISVGLMETAAAVNGKIVFAGYEQMPTTLYKTLIYDTETGTCSYYEGNQAVSYTGNITAWNGKILSSDGENLYIYDVDSHSSKSVALSDPFDKEAEYSLDSLYYDGRIVLLYRTNVYYFADYGYVYAPTQVWALLDPTIGLMTCLGELENSYQTISIISHAEKADGNYEYYIIGVNGLLATEPGFGGESFTFGQEFKSEVLKNLIPEGNYINLDEPNPVTGVGLEGGIYMTGAFGLEDVAANIWDLKADNYSLSYNAVSEGFKPASKRISDSKIYVPVVGAYNGNLVIFGLESPMGSTEGAAAFYTSSGWQTMTPYGDVVFDTDTSVKVKKIKVAKKMTVSTNTVDKLDPEVVFTDAAKTTTVEFESSNTDVLKIGATTGIYQAVNPGTATVTVKCGNKTAKCVVTVANADQKDMIHPYQAPEAGDEISFDLNSGEVDYWQLMNAYSTGKEKIKWKTSDKKVVTVKNGFFTAKKAGNAVVTAVWTSGKETKEFKFNVSVNAVEVPKALTGDKSVKMSAEKKSIKLSKGDSKSFSVNFKGSVPEDYVVKFYTTNTHLLDLEDNKESVEAAVSSNKATVSLNAVGAGTVYLVMEGYSKAAPDKVNRRLCKIVINAPAKEIKILGDSAGKLDGDVIYLKKGSMTSISYTLVPIISTDAAKVSWKAKGGTVTVKNGVITAKKVKKDKKTGEYVPSTVTIKAGSITKEIKVYVVD